MTLDEEHKEILKKIVATHLHGKMKQKGSENACTSIPKE